MSPVPVETRDRWLGRAEPAPGDGAVYWHFLVGDNRDLRVVVRDVQERLSPFGGFHLTP